MEHFPLMKALAGVLAQSLGMFASAKVERGHQEGDRKTVTTIGMSRQRPIVLRHITTFTDNSTTFDHVTARITKYHKASRQLHGK